MTSTHHNTPPNKNDVNRCQCVTPFNYGWLQYNLNKEELDYIWKCVDDKQRDVSLLLAGNISCSYELEDKNNWLMNRVLKPLIATYVKDFGDRALPNKLPIKLKSDLNYNSFTLNNWWVNYQKQHDFNPIHDHSGVYSFVIWLKIPTEFDEQNIGSKSNAPIKSSFSFSYTNILAV